MTIRSNDWNGLTLSNGRYRITAKLGEGGMGSVYRALDKNLDADVVIKIPRPTMMDDPEFAARFTREVRSLVRLSHPHIVKVTDVGTWEDTPFAVMQYLAGGSLEDRRPTGPGGAGIPCDPGSVPQWLEAVAAALDYVHAQGYVHRDVKPGNILFDAEGHAFLSDFGVAKVLATSTHSRASQTAMTGAGMVVGTPEYMAPELIMGEPFDGRADQYALAVTVYELLCGRRPFEDETKTRLLVLHTTKAPPRLTEWRPSLPERVSQSVLKGLSKNPSERYPTCTAMAAAVATSIAGAGARDERVRLKCPRCGSTGAIARADLVKLKESGRGLSCTSCRATLDFPGASGSSGSVSTRAGSGNTTPISQPGRPAEHARPPESGRAVARTTALPAQRTSGEHHSPRTPTACSGATRALSSPAAPGESRNSHEPKSPSATRESRTLIEQAPRQSDRGPGIGATMTDPEAESGSARSPIAGRIWVGIGAGVSVSMLTLSLVIWMVATRGAAKPGDLAPTPKVEADELARSLVATVVPGAPPAGPVSPPTLAAEKASPQPMEPAPTEAPEPASEPLPDLANRRSPARPDPAVVKSAPPDASEKDERDHPSPPSIGPLVAENAAESKAKAVAAPIARKPFDTSLLKGISGHRTVSLDKLLASPRSYLNQIVVLAGLFQVANSRHDRSDGTWKCSVTEWKFEAGRNGGPPKMSPSLSTEMEVEPKLAECLEGLDPGQREGKGVSILTLYVPSSGVCCLVKIEILHKTTYGVKKGFKHQPDIEYETLSVTSEGAKFVKGDDLEWEKVGRMHLFAKQYKNWFNGLKRQAQNAEQDRMVAQMGVMFQQSMQSVLAAEQQRLRLQQQVSGR